jgi:hypothetical protein
MHWQWSVNHVLNVWRREANIPCRDIAKTISLEERDMYWRRSEVYRHWLLNKIFKVDDSITVMVFPIEVGKPNYRDAELP